MISPLLSGAIVLLFLLFVRPPPPPPPAANSPSQIDKPQKTTQLRLLSITPSITRTHRPSPFPSAKKPHILYILGSGGHTTEMLSLISSSRPSRYKRTYMISRGDALSAKKAAAFESASASPSSYDILEIPRARLVGQSWLSTPWTCAACLVGCVRAFTRVGLPDLVVCNGPGSAVVAVGVCFFCKVCFRVFFYIFFMNSLIGSGWG